MHKRKFNTFVFSLAESWDLRLCRKSGIYQSVTTVLPLSRLKEKLQVFLFSSETKEKLSAKLLFSYQVASKHRVNWYFYSVIVIPCRSCVTNGRRYLSHIYEKSLHEEIVGEVVNEIIQLRGPLLDGNHVVCAGWNCFREELRRKIVPRIVYLEGIEKSETSLMKQILQYNKNLSIRHSIQLRRSEGSFFDGNGHPLLSKPKRRSGVVRYVN